MTSSIKNIDHKVVTGLRNGDAIAFDILFNKYSQRLYSFSYKCLKSEEEAEEVVQEVFLYIWEKKDGLKSEYSFNSYIFTIAYNIIKKHFNKKAKENAFKDEIIYLSLEERNNLDQIIDYKYLLNRVEKVIDSLPERRREIFIKRKYEGLSIKQIATELGISPNTVENQLSLAQKLINKELQKERLAGILFFMLFF